MNILKDIKIKGDIFLEYAFLSYTLFFESSLDTKADYSFVLPKGSLVSSLRLFYNNKIIETKITSASHTAMALSSEDAFLTLRKVKNDEYILSIDNVDQKGLTLMLSIYAPLCENRLSVPLAKRGNGSGIASHTAEIELNTLSADNVSSPTHEITLSNKKITTGKITASKDFALILDNAQKISSGILQRNISGGEALLKIYPDVSLSFNKKLLLVYDRDNVSSKTTSVMARDFIYASAKNYNGPFAVAVSNELLTDGFVNATDDVLSGLLNSLSNITSGSYPCPDITDDTAIILLTENPDAFPTENFKNLYTVTFGSASSSGYHIYPNENIELRAENIIKDIMFCEKFKSCSIEASDGETSLIDYSLENGITVYIKYTGTFPEKLFILKDGQKEEFSVQNIKAYDSFSPIRLVCAEVKQRLLYKKLMFCSPDEVSSVRKELEDIGLRYSALNSETALIASLDKATAPVRVIIPGDADAFTESAVSMFREHTSAPDEAFIFISIEYILKNIRGDGAICTDGEINQEIRKKLSKICLAALTIADKTDYTKKTEEFLSFKFSDKHQAREYLLSIFKEDSFIPKDVPLDLLTAAKIILSI